MLRRDKRLPYPRLIDYAIQICRGLAAAHARGIVHRDIKPANIWIDEEQDRIKILDFGLALASVAMDQLSGRGSVVGTPQYLSPEQASSEPLDDRSDLYSLGVVLFELSTGQLPFAARAVADQLIATLAMTPPKARDVSAEVPEPLSELIAQLMQKEPRKRPRSAMALEAQLQQVARECEAKSDVALTINKLQESLLQVANKKEPLELTPSSKTPPVVVTAAAAKSATAAKPEPAFGFDFPSPTLPAAAGSAALPAFPPNRMGSRRQLCLAGFQAGQPVLRSRCGQPQVNLARIWPFAVVGASPSCC